MKALLISLVLIAAPGKVFADISDSGNLSIGNQAVVQGTMTVVGNAFSVSGATLTVAGGSIGISTGSPAAMLDVNGSAVFGSGVMKSTFTSTGLLNLNSNGIRWADGSTSTTAASGTVGSNSALAPYQGINYLLWSSSGAAVADSTATFSFNVEASSFVFRGLVYTQSKKNFAVVASTHTIITWNPTNGFRQWGVVDFNPATVSSRTVNSFNDDIIVAASSSSTNGNIYIFNTAQTVPFPTSSEALGKRYITGALSPPNAYPSFDCGANFWFEQCDTNAPQAKMTGADTIFLDCASSVQLQCKETYIVYNSGSSAASMLVSNSGDGYTWYCVNGKSNGGSCVQITSGAHVTATISIPSGYSILELYEGYNGGAGAFSTRVQGRLPAKVSIVRQGPF